MRLAVSNLAWPSGQEDAAYELLASLGVPGVEVAPTRLGPWNAWPVARLVEHRAKFAAAGLVVSSLQAILYGRIEPQLLGDASTFRHMHEHMRLVAEIAAALGATALVFGSPRNRRRGEMPAERAGELARERLYLLGDVVMDAGAVLAIEPVPAAYGGDFLGSWREVLRLVEDVNHPGVRVHLDTAGVGLAGDSIGDAVAACKDRIAHFHAAQPHLVAFSPPERNHAEAAAALNAIGYDKWLSIEMREQPDNPFGAIKDAVLVVQKIYGLG
jgi:sugar phosphate isomerase/epimerase